MTSPYTAKIIKHLEHVLSSGNDQSRIFEDWLEMVEASLEALPRHVRAAQAGQSLEDTPEVQKAWERFEVRYKHPDYWKHFAGALGELLNSAVEFDDVIGQVYMAWGIPNKWTGQFFTPFDLAEAMADITLGDIEAEIHARMKSAIRDDPLAQATLMAGLFCSTPEEAEAWFIDRVLPAAAPHVNPITILDCCCGSGVMLLAAAKHCPRWALDWGLVRFYGQDIDLTCVRMARVNMMLYGLNGYNLKCALAMSGAELAELPAMYEAAYTEAQQAEAAGDVERVQEIAVQVRSRTYEPRPAVEQPVLFEVMPERDDQPRRQEKAKPAPRKSVVEVESIPLF